MVGADKATHAGFNYSATLTSMEGNWTYENLDGFIENPRGYAPGTNMSFAGLRSEEDRADLLAYLQTLSDNPVPFPAPAPAEAEATGDEHGDEHGGEMTEGDDAAMTADGEDGDAPAINEQEAESQAAAGDEDLTTEPETTDEENGDGEE